MILFNANTSSWAVALTRVKTDSDEPLVLSQLGYLIRDTGWARCGLEVPIYGVLTELILGLRIVRSEPRHQYDSVYEGVGPIHLASGQDEVTIRFTLDSHRFEDVVPLSYALASTEKCLRELGSLPASSRIAFDEAIRQIS